ncbi:MAG: hypothetical protein Q7T82_08240, partial [Armatimonadota bacterium]|nr:hypothetical protein [Armatimonadota bacterium]
MIPCITVLASFVPFVTTISPEGGRSLIISDNQIYIRWWGFVKRGKSSQILDCESDVRIGSRLVASFDRANALIRGFVLSHERILRRLVRNPCC